MKALENHFYGKNSRFRGKKQFKTMKKTPFLPDHRLFFVLNTVLSTQKRVGVEEATFADLKR